MSKMGSHNPFGHLKHLDLVLIGGLNETLWAPKVIRVPTVGILGLPGQNDIWVLIPWLVTEYTIKG